MLRWNTKGDYPQIDESCYIDDSAVIIGNVSVGRHVFIGPGAVIRADDDGSVIKIGDNCDIQDRVVIHSLAGTEVCLGRNVSLTHGSIIHGPCRIEDNCFVGFNSVVFASNLGEGAVILNLSCIEGVDIPKGKIVMSAKAVSCQRQADELEDVGHVLNKTAGDICRLNLELLKEHMKRK